MKQKLLLMLIILILSTIVVAQETKVKLPTTDNSSTFKVTKSNDNTILNVRADGKIGIRKDDPSTALDVDGTVTALQYLGDGSQLTNVKSIANYFQGYTPIQLPGGNTITKVREVSINVPANGVVLIFVSGTADWESTSADVFRGCISNNSSLSNIDPNNAMYYTDFNCTDSSDQYSTFSIQRAYNVNSAGTYTYYFYADNPTFATGFSNSKVELKYVNMIAVYIPTGSVSVAEPIAPPQEDKQPSLARLNIPGRRLDGSIPSASEEPEEQIDNISRIERLEAILEKQQKLIDELIRKK